MKRRNFLAASGLAALASCQQSAGSESNDTSTDSVAAQVTKPVLPPFSVSPGGGTLYWGPGGDKYEFLVTGKQSGGTTFILNANVPVGGGPPPHIHNNESESYYIEEGELLFSVGDKTIDARAGDFVHIPKGTVHTFTNKGTVGARMLSIFAPSGMEGWFEDALVPVKSTDTKPHEYTHKELDYMIEVGPKHGVTWVLPPKPEAPKKQA